MKTLLKNGTVVNVFTLELIKENVLISDDRIIGCGDYSDEDADMVIDVSGKILCPGLIDGHIHIESTMMKPSELAKVCIPHGTTTIIADPHEIANVCGNTGIEFMLRASENIPLRVFIMLPSCVPSTPFDESGACLTAKELEHFYGRERVLGLAEMMNYPGVISGDKDVFAKINSAISKGFVVNGHAPLLYGRDLDKYIAAGINDDHECSNFEEAKEKMQKGQWIMIREGTAARNLNELLPLFDEPYYSRALLVTDDRHPADLLKDGDIDNIIRKAVKNGKNPLIAIRMGTLNAAICFGIRDMGAIAPGFKADILVLDDLENFIVNDVFKDGKRVLENKKMADFEEPKVSDEIMDKILNSFNFDNVKESDFHIEPKGKKVRVIEMLPKQLITNEIVTDLDFSKNNGIDISRDILKLAVVERHKNTHHIGLGFIHGMGLKRGAIASSVSHDSHNIIVVGTNEKDMAVATNRMKETGGGLIVVLDGKVLSEMSLSLGGLMTNTDCKTAAENNLKVRNDVYKLGVPENIEPFMSMAFVSLPVIPHIKMSTQGLVDVTKWQKVDLFVKE